MSLDTVKKFVRSFVRSAIPLDASDQSKLLRLPDLIFPYQVSSHS